MQNLLFDDFFKHRVSPIFAEAPGRIDVMCGIADYSGAWALQMPISLTTKVWLAKRPDSIIRVASVSNEKKVTIFEVDGNQLLHQTDADLINTGKHIRGLPEGNWAAYVVGCLLIYANYNQTELFGADFWVESDIPLGKGVSSSAALEVATLRAIFNLLDQSTDGTLLPLMAQKVENLIVGAPCGIMDQIASHLGKPNHLIPILCQPDKVFEPIRLPENLKIIAIDSGVRHSVGGASYGQVRTAAFMGFALLAKHLGYSNSDLIFASQSKDWSNLPFHGYWANVTPSYFDEIKHILPERISGKEFIEQNLELHDSLSVVNPDTEYLVRNCSQFPVATNHLVKQFQVLLTTETVEGSEKYTQLGQLLFEAHKWYQKCNINESFSDKLVEMAKTIGAENGIYGAKITGGGSGGSVCFLIDYEIGAKSIEKVLSDYKSITGFDVTIIR